MGIKCTFCERDLLHASAQQLSHAAIGNRVYCSMQCRNAFYNRNCGLTTQGPCPTCGRMFESRKAKKFCSMGCYTSSHEFKERLTLRNKAGRLPRGECLQCGKTCPRLRMKCCSRSCQRSFYASRFDRWVANPERIALPQCYDEFMSQNELPCLVDGCDWIGKFLGTHVNICHGISAKQFKELAGFNLGTGLVSSDLREQMSEKARKQIASGNFAGDTEIITEVRPPERAYRSLEGKEHGVKSRAVAKITNPPRAPIPCVQCGELVAQPVMGKQLYCSPLCRSKNYETRGTSELTCSFCGVVFVAKRVQVLRAQRGLKTCCSCDCRNQMNMIACLSARGVNFKSSRRGGE